MRYLIVVEILAALCGCGSSGDDARRQALALAKDDIACTVSADCCAVVDDCLTQVLLVSAADRAEAAELLASAPDDMCTACMVPPVQVDCVGGQCVAVEIIQDGSGTGVDWPAELTHDHCGALEIPAGWMEKPPVMNASLGVRPATVIGCGD
jgi:hypothetical protein